LHQRASSIIAAFVLGLSVTACSENPVELDPIDSTVARSLIQDVPIRSGDYGSTWLAMSDMQLWETISQRGGTAIIGLKEPGSRRGVYQNRLFVAAARKTAFRDVVQRTDGIQIIEASEYLPALLVEVKTREALTALRRLPFIDYIEPSKLNRTGVTDSGVNAALSHVTAQSSDSGCNYNPTTASGTTFAGDALPPHYQTMQIVDAWNRAAGAGVVIGITDTGISPTQGELNGSFAGGYSTGRWVKHLYTYGGTWHATCSHGTRIAGVAAAPMNGQNMAGVAWKAHLVTVRQTDDDIAFVDSYNAATAIWDASRYNASITDHRRIVLMAWQSNDGSNYVSDAIRFNYGNGVLFIAASGTSFAVVNSIAGVVFPAVMSEVVAVSAVDANKNKTGSVHYGSQVEVSAYVNQVTTGQYTNDVVRLGGSSGTSSLVAGIAAIIWSKYPNLTRNQVREKLRSAGHYYPNRNDTFGYGVVNAFKAVGGLIFVGISGSTQVQPASATAYQYTAQPQIGVGPFQYQWSVNNAGVQLSGATSPTVNATVGPEDQPAFTLTVRVTDTYDGKVVLNQKTVGVLPVGCEPGKTCDNLVGEGEDALRGAVSVRREQG
jgi:serine protease